jgi:hypothetical protein
MHRCLQVNGTVNGIYHYQLIRFSYTDKRLLFTQRSNVQPVISIMKEGKKSNNVRKKKAIKSILCIVFNQT